MDTPLQLGQNQRIARGRQRLQSSRKTPMTNILHHLSLLSDFPSYLDSILDKLSKAEVLSVSRPSERFRRTIEVN